MFTPPDQQDRRAEYRRTHPPAPLPAPPGILELAARRLVVFANVTQDSGNRFLGLPAYWRGAITADPGYQGPMVQALIAASSKAGRILHPWCDCRQPDGDPPGTPFSAARELQQRYGLAEPIGQAESDGEYVHAIGNGARIVFGNPSNLSADAIADAIGRCRAGELAFIGEMYRPDPGYTAQGIPIASVLYGVALDAGSYCPVVVYTAASSPTQRATFCVYHAAGLQPPDWQLMAELGI